MNCTDSKNLLFLSQEGKLKEEEKILLQNHLAECKKCAFDFNFLTSIENTLRTSEKVKAPDYLKDRITSNIFPVFESKKEKYELGIFSIAGALISIIAIFFFFPFEALISELQSSNIFNIENILVKFQYDAIFNIENILAKFEDAFIYLSEISFHSLSIVSFIIMSIVFFLYEYISYQDIKIKNYSRVI